MSINKTDLDSHITGQDEQIEQPTDARVLYSSPRLLIMEKMVDGVQTYRVNDRLHGAFGKDYYDSLDVFHLMLAELVRMNPKAKKNAIARQSV